MWTTKTKTGDSFLHFHDPMNWL